MRSAPSRAGSGPEGPGVRMLTPGWRALSAVAAALVIVAGIQLFVLSERTEDFFAWTIALPLTAAVDGAFYLSALPLFLSGTMRQPWVQARTFLPVVFVVSSGKLAATLLHLEPFHFESASAPARFAAWGWLAIYLLIPPAVVVLTIHQSRVPGGDPPVVDPPPRWYRWFASTLGTGMIVVGAAMLLAPSMVIPRWPWALTPLTCRALSAWFLGVGVVAILMARSNDLRRAYPAVVSAVVMSILLGVALARYPDPVRWESPSAWLFLLLMAGLLLLGVAGLLHLRGTRFSEPPRA